ncbi:oxidoreductase [Bacillus sp. T33-2]|uniref:oxidoreductase n=1 Tax=Bacillus sp. T33-2 TaxID=2054168 RepID=UPI000C75AD99|nr:oxidoreductase [Bacillus sp. T33-2]PLR95294.1 oxidoreductase [Bacillus sp. T33-2]
MTEIYKSALLVGASGLTGKELLHYLLESAAYNKVTVLVRKHINIEHQKLEQIVVDFDQLENYEKHFKVNDVYCCLGTTIKKAGSQETFRKVDFDYPITLCKLARKNEVEKFLVITALGAKANSRIFYNRIKGEVEEQVKKIGIPSLHIFQPSLLLGDRAEYRPGEHIAASLTPFFKFFLTGGLRKFRPIRAKDVALAMYLTGQKSVRGTYTYQSDQIEDVSRQEQHK